jgi:Ran GTPase-activating protein (RanGAP) involved in mRNA processing and transport
LLISRRSLPCRARSFGGNHIGDAGAESLAKALPASKLETLYVNSNHIGDAGAAALAKALPASKLLKLDVAYNEIGDAGAAAFAKTLPETKQLKVLDFEDNKISPVGVGLMKPFGKRVAL